MWVSGFAALISTAFAVPALAVPTCARTLTADVVAIDQPITYNRLGASNINGMMYALKRDVVYKETGVPLGVEPAGAIPGKVELRPDKRPRPLILRVAAGDCLDVTLTNLLSAAPNPNNIPRAGPPQINVFIDEQVADRHVGFNVAGLELRNNISDDGSMVGNVTSGAGSLLAPGQSTTYRLYAPREGVYIVQSYGATIGADANQGNSGNGLFGQVIAQPPGARIYRNAVTEEDMRLAIVGTTPKGLPKIDYEARYPNQAPWTAEGKAGLPILNMIDTATNQIVHTEIDAVVAGPNADGTFPASTYPLESKGKRNPTVPNRLEAFRDFAQAWHDEPATAQAFPGFFKDDPVFRYVLAGVKDGFMINYGSGGIGSEIIASRLGVGPMHDCLSCAYEEFFLTSYTVGDPALLVDVPANAGLETLLPGQAPPLGATGPKAYFAMYPDDPSNVNHSYIGDFTKYRNSHIGKEQHVFHLHNHQWLYNPNDDNSNYLDAQSLGPGSGYTYEINFGGSGNRNKSAGDAIYHCHFYPHFAQGMWHLWRIHDVTETGTLLAASIAAGSVTVLGKSGTFHGTRFALKNGTPAVGTRALPDGEIAVGTPIPAVLPVPGKGMPPLPSSVTVRVNPLLTPLGLPVGSLAKVDRPSALGPDGIAGTVDDKNPGYPFWVAGIEQIVGQRPPTPPLDMATAADVAAAQAANATLFADLKPAQADGWDGGLRRHALKGNAAGGHALVTVSPIDFSKVIESSGVEYFPEIGTDLEHVAMNFHAKREHASDALMLDGAAPADAPFVVNGAKPAIGAVYHEPCIDDTGRRMGSGVLGTFFSGESRTAMSTRGRSNFNADNPRIYKGANMQFDVILNKTGYHYPQQRIIALWEDVMPTINKTKAPEPLVMRLNTFDCAVYSHSNLVPEVYEMDDYQVRTPTDIIGQHIHLPKWDLTTTDGAANGWNYEDGTLSPGAIRERIHAIREFNLCLPVDPRDGGNLCPVAKAHPYFGQFGRDDWIGARTTLQRWFVDPVVNVEGEDRGLGIIFTHDHYGPSTHQQIGLYATVLIEPAGSRWVHNETGQQLGAGPDRSGGRADGGPTSWQAAILPPTSAPIGSTVKSETLQPYREFYLEFSDFQHAYEHGVYVGAGPDGRPLPGATPLDRFTGVAAIENAFRFAINPPARQQFNAPLYPNLVLEVAGGQIPDCPTRPCPQAIDVQDPGMFVVNYRAEPVGLRVFDPNKVGPDGKRGMQAAGIPGDLAFALSSRLTDKAGTITQITRAIPDLNTVTGKAPAGYVLNQGALPGDPFTPIMRSYSGDLVRVKIQAGAHEEEHNTSVFGVKWLQGGSGHGKAPNAGWRNAQAAGISEQFTFVMSLRPDVQAVKAVGARDYAYTIDASMDGWWSGSWGILRGYDSMQANLTPLPNNTSVKPDRILNRTQFNGVCPLTAPPVDLKVVAILANDILPKPAGVTIVPANANLATQHVGGALNANGGTLVYNPRGNTVTGEQNGQTVSFNGPLHDPTAMLYVRTDDLEPDPAKGGRVGQGPCKDVTPTKGAPGRPGVANPACPVKLKAGKKVEPLIVRASAGSCVTGNLYNRIPALAPDLPTLGTLIGAVKRERNVVNGGIDIGSTPFDNNLIRPSSHVGLQPQLVALDVTQDSGVNVGINITQTSSPPVADASGTLKLGVIGTFRWYMGDLTFTPTTSSGQGNLTATPIEFGGFGLMPADRVKQGQKSLMGGMVVVAQGATVVEDANQRAQATVTANGKTYRDFMVVMAKDLNHRYRDGSAVQHMNGEAVGIPEDSQENTAMALNYGVEPLWFRFGILPSAPFGGAGCGDGPGCYGGVLNAHEAYSNTLSGNADPVTPVLLANRNQEARIHWAIPHGTSRGSTFKMHGHTWQRAPYRCDGSSRNGLDGACTMTEVGSRNIGTSPYDHYFNSQDSLTPMGHFTFRLDKAGGQFAVRGDYLFRDQGSFGNASGLWGIMRVQ